MQKYAIYGRLQAKAGKEADVEAFLKAGLAHGAAGGVYPALVRLEGR